VKNANLTGTDDGKEVVSGGECTRDIVKSDQKFNRSTRHKLHCSRI